MLSHDFGRCKAAAAQAGALLHYERKTILGLTLTKDKFYLENRAIKNFCLSPLKMAG